VKDVKNLAALRCLRMNLLNSNLPLLQYWVLIVFFFLPGNLM
jgi:hypothetical protein